MAEHSSDPVDHNRAASKLSLLRVGLVLVTLIVAAAVVIATIPRALGVLVFFSLAVGIPVVLTLTVIYGDKTARAFSIGALFPGIGLFTVASCLFVYATFEGWDDLIDDAEGLSMAIVAGLVATPACGVCAVLTRSLWASKGFTNVCQNLQKMQFSLASLMTITLVAALVLTSLFVVPGWITVFLLATTGLVIPVALTTGVVHGRGELQAFCIGGLFPAAVSLATSVCLFVITVFEGDLNFIDRSEVINGMRVGGCAAWIFIVICGQLAVVLRRRLRP